MTTNAPGIAAKTFGLLNRLTKWRTVFASWQLGTRTKEDGECNAVRDHREVTILMRSELNAVMNLLIKKGMISEPELNQAIGVEAEYLMVAYEQQFPGFRADDNGIIMTPLALETIKKMHFPP